MSSADQSDVMTFLNEVASDFPDAISLAAGRPTARLFDRLSPDRLAQALNDYRNRHAKGGSGIEGLLQYGRTAGIVSELVAAQLRTDQMVPARSDAVLVTSGCQEALVLCLAAVCPRPDDVLLLCNPTYTGIVGAAQACQVRTWPLEPGDIGTALESAVGKIEGIGCTPRALYLIPDFDNPTGDVIAETKRREILDLCASHHIVVLEDSAYSLMRFDGDSVPPLAALDEVGCVIHLSTYSKTLCPGMRVGSLTLPESLFGSRPDQQALWQELVQRKSYITVNTSSICQAIVGGLLIDQRCSLRSWIDPTLAVYEVNRDAMLQSLDGEFARFPGEVSWNRPAGGFFLTVDLPFTFDAEAVVRCATDYGVIAMPMAFFAFDNAHDHRVRLAFSSVTSDRISAAVEGFGRYVNGRIEHRSVA